NAETLLERFGYLEPGFGAAYDAARPRPPEVLPAVLMQLARVTRPPTVIDLGSGTGLSTFPWADRAERVEGIEPSSEMRGTASAKNCYGNVRFRGSYAEDTGLPDSVADIVTAASSMNWFDPSRVYGEIGRILRPGGVFAAYYPDW